MGSVLWACVVYEEDAKWLKDHLLGVLDQTPRPDLVAVVDTSNSERIKSVAERSEGSIRDAVEYVPLEENLGFNSGLNKAIAMAVERDTEWLATMTVRAIPDKRWLFKATEAGAPEKVGMVATLHLTSDDLVDCLGHNLGRDGELFDFGQGLTPKALSCRTPQNVPSGLRVLAGRSTEPRP
jgi:GT2 family glycosyltransferase